MTSTPVIAIPSYDGNIMAAVVPELVQADRAGVEYSILPGESLISRARSHLATKLAPHYSHIVWIDSDVVFTYEQVREILTLSIDHNAIVSGWYPKRRMREGWALSVADDNQRLLLAGPPENTTELIACGFGFVVTPTWVFSALQEKHGLREVNAIIPYFLPQLTPSGEFVGEDYSFCAKARELPICLLAARNVLLKHRGMYDFGVADTGGPLPCTWAEQRYLEDRWFDGTMSQPTKLSDQTGVHEHAGKHPSRA